MAWKSEAPTQPGFYWLIAPGWEQPIVGEFSEGTWMLLGDEVPYKTDALSRHMKFWDEPLKLPTAAMKHRCKACGWTGEVLGDKRTAEGDVAECCPMCDSDDVEVRTDGELPWGTGETGTGGIR